MDLLARSGPPLHESPARRPSPQPAVEPVGCDRGQQRRLNRSHAVVPCLVSDPVQPKGRDGVLPGVSTTAPAIENLIQRLSRDVDSAFDEFVAEYRDIVFTAALRLSNQPADAEDIAAEAFLRAYAALRGYHPDRIRQLQLRPWLITIVLNLWRNQLRSAGRRPAQVGIDAAGQPTAAGAGPEEHSQQRDQRRQLAGLLSQLSDRQRAAVVLRHVVGLGLAEVAQILGCPEGTAKSHVSRGLRRLRALSQEGSS